MSIEHISTIFMIADPLTKGVPPKAFHEYVARMGVVRVWFILVIYLYSGSLLIVVHLLMTCFSYQTQVLFLFCLLKTLKQSIFLQL